MPETLRPETPEQLAEAVAWANSDGAALDLAGGGSKRALGRPVAADWTLDLSHFAGIDLYEPEELVLRAGAATPLATLEAALADAGQEFAFEPPDYSALLAGAVAGDGERSSGAGTLGGVLAGNLAGPRRVKAGAARDHFLGFAGVTGRGGPFKSGGRVVKNVTGYDLCKLMAGSWGTLAALHQVTVKVLPRAETGATVLLHGPDAARGVNALSAALNTPYEVSGAAWLPAPAARRTGVAALAETDAPLAGVRIEGFAPSVAYRAEQLTALLTEHGEVTRLEASDSAAFWRTVRDVRPFAAPGDDRTVWKVSLPPTDAPAFLDRVSEIKGAEAYCDWGGGLVWLAVDAPNTGGAELVRGALAHARSGHATLIRGSEALRAAVPVFQPLPEGLAALTRRLKDSFDPNRVLNPGRMHAEV